MRLGPAVAVILTLCTVVLAGAPDGPRAEHLDSYRWRHDARWFGGFSGIEMATDGQSMTVLGDRGILLQATIDRQGDSIRDIRITSKTLLRSSTGAALTGRILDSEGLVVAPGGAIFISYEIVHRVARHAAPAANAHVLPRPPVFDTFEENRSFEALAQDARGRLYTLPEEMPDRGDPIPVFRWDGANWSVPFSLPAESRFSPVGADFGPDGRLYLLERAVTLLGFRSRLRRWSVTDDGLGEEQVLLVTGMGTHDNLEGLSIWRDAQGRIRATMVSDDNFMFFQRTEIVEYVVTE